MAKRHSIVRKWLEQEQGKHVCACGCGEAIAIIQDHKYRGIPKFVRGHGGKVIRGLPEERFWKSINKTEGCWEWTGFTNDDGYGKIAINGEPVSVHRFSYQLHYGEIPLGLQVLHKCDNPPCCRPDHLFLGTRDENHKDKTIKCRAARKLDARRVEDIVRRVRAGESTVSLARAFGISHSGVSKIMSGLNWSHVTGIQPREVPLGR